jgi:AcrR family transcriptional regulator
MGLAQAQATDGATAAKPRPRKRDRARNAILDATSELIAERGTDGFTISEVSRRAGINRALIYHYFTDRPNLIFQAIRHIVNKYEQVRPAIGPDAFEHDIRMHIEHPELARFFFQLMMRGDRLPQMSQRLQNAIGDLQRYKDEHAPGARFDVPIAVLASWLTQLAWSCARDEMARYMEITTAEADDRFVRHLKQSAGFSLKVLSAEGAKVPEVTG